MSFGLFHENYTEFIKNFIKSIVKREIKFFT